MCSLTPDSHAGELVKLCKGYAHGERIGLEDWRHETIGRGRIGLS
jgi:hypothetical protein